MAKERIKGKSLTKFVPDYCVVDIETTGLDPRWDNILEISALKVRNKEIIETFTTLVSPDNFTEVDDFISELTGITTEMILLDGISTKQALVEFKNFVSADMIVGHNVNFDINFLYDNIKRYFDEDFSNDYIDTLRLARHAFPDEKHHRLKDLVKLFSIDFDRMHRALDDCKITKIVFDECEKILGVDWVFISSYNKKIKFDLREIIAEKQDFDTEHLFYDKYFVFTGKLENFTRIEASQIVANIGGHPQNGINKDTNFLVVGSFDYVKNIKDGMSGKQKKALEKQISGQDIQIITEEIFLEQISDNISSKTKSGEKNDK